MVWPQLVVADMCLLHEPQPTTNTILVGQTTAEASHFCTMFMLDHPAPSRQIFAAQMNGPAALAQCVLHIFDQYFEPLNQSSHLNSSKISHAFCIRAIGLRDCGKFIIIINVAQRGNCNCNRFRARMHHIYVDAHILDLCPRSMPTVSGSKCFGVAFTPHVFFLLTSPASNAPFRNLGPSI